MKNVFFASLFVVGAILTATVDLQLSVGVILMVFAYNELRKVGINLSQVDDVLIDQLRDIVNRWESNKNNEETKS